MPDPASNSYGDLNVLSSDPICAGVFLPDMDLPISKTGMGATSSWVRIPLSPPLLGTKKALRPKSGRLLLW